jgi:ribosomal protein S18 acetylase RimI-like enzyme
MKPIVYQCYEGQPTPQVLTWLVKMNDATFGFGESVERVAQFFKRRTDVLLCFAFIDSEPVGFKAGARLEAEVFESWRGGVLPRTRRLGIARALMELQHHWCVHRAFRRIQTVTSGDNTSMLSLNQQSGFVVVESFVRENGKLKIVQEKYL